MCTSNLHRYRCSASDFIQQWLVVSGCVERDYVLQSQGMGEKGNSKTSEVSQTGSYYYGVVNYLAEVKVIIRDAWPLVGGAYSSSRAASRNLTKLLFSFFCSKICTNWYVRCAEMYGV